MENKEIQMPVNSLSYSSLTKLLRNPLIWKMSEVLGVYTGRRGVSSMVGSAGHQALKVYYGGDPEVPTPTDRDEAIALAMETGIKYIDSYPDAGIRYGKTGSREQILQGFSTAMNMYFAEEPKYKDIVACEEKMTARFKDENGNEFPLPSSGIADLVVRVEKGVVDIIDHKFTRSFTKHEDDDGEPYEDYIKIVQAMFMKHLIEANTEDKVRYIIFREIKWTKNRDGGSQISDYVIPADHEPYNVLFQNLYKDVVNFLKNPNAIFLPNLSDPFDGQEAGLLYSQGLISADMSDVEVMHRVKEVAFTSKRFVPSILDRAENDSLAPEERVKVKLREFGVFLFPEETKHGDNVTQYRFRVAAGTSMARIKKHKDDIIQALMVKGEIRILAPIPGTKLVGIEVEKEDRKSKKLTKEHLEENSLMLPIGTDVGGDVVKVPLDAMPHLLIAGATGSGKSVLLHNLLDALTKQMTPEAMELVLIDPKRVELSRFAKKKHVPKKRIIYEYEDAVMELMRLSDLMDERYDILESAGKRDLTEFNASKRKESLKLPYVVVVIDEFADFILRSKLNKKKWKVGGYSGKTKAWLVREIKKRVKDGADVGSLNLEAIGKITNPGLVDILEQLDEKNPLMRADADIEVLMVRLAQLGRAAGIHLIIATQRPSVDVITGLIKANFPTRIALTTASAVDSKVILGKPGAEKLAGKGDMLFLHPALKGEQRLQGFNLK